MIESNLKSIRIAAGLSQPQLSEESGVNLRSIRAYEQGTRDLHKAAYREVEAIAKALSIEPKQLFE